MPNSPPVTEIRTSHALSIRADKVGTVGVINNWSQTQTRQVTHIYEIDPQTSGTPIEAIPGNVGGLTIAVGRYDTYSSRMEQAFGTTNFEMLSEQIIPFNVSERWRYPTGFSEAREYQGCWFNSIGRQYQASGDRIVNVNGSLTFVKRKSLG